MCPGRKWSTLISSSAAPTTYMPISIFPTYNPDKDLQPVKVVGGVRINSPVRQHAARSRCWPRSPYLLNRHTLSAFCRVSDRIMTEYYTIGCNVRDAASSTIAFNFLRFPTANCTDVSYQMAQVPENNIIDLSGDAKKTGQGKVY